MPRFNLFNAAAKKTFIEPLYIIAGRWPLISSILVGHDAALTHSHFTGICAIFSYALAATSLTRHDGLPAADDDIFEQLLARFGPPIAWRSDAAIDAHTDSFLPELLAREI